MTVRDKEKARETLRDASEAGLESKSYYDTSSPHVYDFHKVVLPKAAAANIIYNTMFTTQVTAKEVVLCPAKGATVVHLRIPGAAIDSWNDSTCIAR